MLLYRSMTTRNGTPDASAATDAALSGIASGTRVDQTAGGGASESAPVEALVSSGEVGVAVRSPMGAERPLLPSASHSHFDVRPEQQKSGSGRSVQLNSSI